MSKQMAWKGVYKLTTAQLATLVMRCCASPGDFHRIICGINMGRGEYRNGCFIPPCRFVAEQDWKAPADLLVYRSRARAGRYQKGYYRCHGEQQGESVYTLPVQGPYSTALAAILDPVVVYSQEGAIQRFEVEE